MGFPQVSLRFSLVVPTLKNIEKQWKQKHWKSIENIEKHCKLKKVKYSRITDRIIIYGNEIESIISKFEKEKDLSDIISRRGTLEDVFLNLTGRQLRD